MPLAKPEIGEFIASLPANIPEETLKQWDEGLLRASEAALAQGKKSPVLKELREEHGDNPLMQFLIDRKTQHLPLTGLAAWTSRLRLGFLKRHVTWFFGAVVQHKLRALIAFTAALIVSKGWLDFAVWPKYAPEPIAAATASFPSPDGPFERTQPYFVSRWRATHVVAPPRGFAIDGDLGDWRLSCRFENACLGELGRGHSFRAGVMADRDNLYLAVDVRDPYPLRNRIVADGDAVKHAENIVRGGAVEVFLELPSAESGSDLVDENARLARLILWFDANQKDLAKTPALLVGRRHKYESYRNGEGGLSAQSRIASDRLGYSLEYQIPWKTLGVDLAQTRSTFETRMSVTVHWSDRNGGQARGKLIDLVNPDNELLPERTAEAWGKAVFHLDE